MLWSILPHTSKSKAEHYAREGCLAAAASIESIDSVTAEPQSHALVEILVTFIIDSMKVAQREQREGDLLRSGRR